MHAFDVLGDPVRRRILELLADAGQLDPTGSVAAESIAATIGDEFGISQPAVSQHLRVLRDAGFASVTVDRAAQALRSRHPSAARARPLARPIPVVLGPTPGRARHRTARLHVE